MNIKMAIDLAKQELMTAKGNLAVVSPEDTDAYDFLTYRVWVAERRYNRLLSIAKTLHEDDVEYARIREEEQRKKAQQELSLRGLPDRIHHSRDYAPEIGVPDMRGQYFGDGIPGAAVAAGE